MKETGIIFSLGFIGHKAAKLQELFSEYSLEPNEYGKFLRFEDYSYLVYNQGVTVWTNCFENENEFNERLLLKLISKL
jgi:hypothetical protein